MAIARRLTHYGELIRFKKPIGTMLLLWPTLWALWLAAHGMPPMKLLLVFSLGVFLMRSAGCIANDIADRNVDGYVKRTQSRPLASGTVSVIEAAMLLVMFALGAFVLVLQTNELTIKLSFLGLFLATGYPLLKRVTHMPQLGLGVAFAWSVPMAFAAVSDFIPANAWYVFLVVVIWPIIYDTMYAMVDREDDLKIGIKSSAILFGENDIFAIAFLQLVMLLMLLGMGLLFHLGRAYYFSLMVVANLFCYQLYLIKHREPSACFKAFLNNQWVGLVVFLGIFLSYVERV